MWTSLFTVAKKEVLHTLRERGALKTMAIMQVFQMLTFGVVDTAPRDLPMVVVDDDRSSDSREFVEKLRATTVVKVKYLAYSKAEARELVRSGRARVALVIPSDFHEKRVLGSGASILTMADGSDAVATAASMGAIQRLAAQMNIEALTESAGSESELPISAHTLMLFNPQGRTSYYLLPGMLAMMLQGFMTMSANALVRERTMGTMDRLLMTPLSTTGLLLGKLSPFIVLGLVDVASVAIAMRWIFDVPIRGSLALLFLAMTLYIVTLLAVGTYVAASAKTIPEVFQKVILFSLSAIFLAGFLFPLAGVPKWLLPISYALPQTHMVEISRAIILRGATFSDLAVHFAALTIAPIVLIWRANVAFRRTIQT